MKRNKLVRSIIVLLFCGIFCIPSNASIVSAGNSSGIGISKKVQVQTVPTPPVVTKKPLSQRWNDFNGIRLQRDMYSAFLIMNISSDLKSFDMDKCNERFENFYRLHNLEVDRLKGQKNLSSISI